MRNSNVLKLFILCLTVILTFSSCVKSEEQHKPSVDESMKAFQKVLEDPELCGMTLTAYISNNACIAYEYTVSDLISDVEERYPENKIFVDTETLKQHRETLSQINSENFTPVEDPNEIMVANICLVFSTKEQGKILEIVEGGFSKETVVLRGEEVNFALFVNGAEVQYNVLFWDIFEKIIEREETN